MAEPNHSEYKLINRAGFFGNQNFDSFNFDRRINLIERVQIMWMKKAKAWGTAFPKK